MKRRTFLKNGTMAAGALATVPRVLHGRDPLVPSTKPEFPLLDLHVHTTPTFPVERILELGRERGVGFGVVEHPAPWMLKDDNDLKAYIDKMRAYPVYVGLQPTYPGWYKNYSRELIDQVDYILMDPQMVPKGNGELWQIWEFDTYIPDTEEFMKRYMDYALEILNNEPIDVFAWPLFLPVCIARDYYELWTEERMQAILSAARARNIAIEINDMAHTPHEAFIRKAKAQGLKFTFGSDSRNENVGKLDYCKPLIESCGLEASDFFVPI
ncbi:MAG: hypothetical protein R2751_08630 [Bacteroidales bacterium]